MFAAALLAVAVSALTFLTLHGLYPEAFNDTRPLLVELGHFLWATFAHFDLGDSTARPLGPVTEQIARGLAADFSLLIGALSFGVAAGAWGGAVCARQPGTWRARFRHRQNGRRKNSSFARRVSEGCSPPKRLENPASR